MSRVRFASRLLLAVAIPILGPGVAHAAHNETTLVGLKVTVTDVTDNTVTIEVSGRGYDSTELPSARLGSQFWFDYSTSEASFDRWTDTVPPAIDWGDGSTIANTGVPITSRVSSTSTSGRYIAYFKGQFMHTYAAPGSYTIRAFGPNAYAPCCGAMGSLTDYASGQITEGNPYTVVSPGIAYNSGSTTYSNWYTGARSVGVTNTAAATVPGEGLTFVPSSSSGDCGLLGIEPVLLFPLLARKRRKRRAAG